MLSQRSLVQTQGIFMKEHLNSGGTELHEGAIRIIELIDVNNRGPYISSLSFITYVCSRLWSRILRCSNICTGTHITGENRDAMLLMTGKYYRITYDIIVILYCIVENIG